jgi:hypothetical protein
MSWTDNEEIPDQASKAPPALAAFQGRLHMVHLGDSSNDLWWSIYDGVSWKKPDGTPGNERIPGQKSKATPALAAVGNQLHMVHLGDSSDDLWWSIYDGTEWRKPDGTPGNERIPDQQSKAAPALAEFAGRLYLVHLGESSNDLWWSINSGNEWRRPDGALGNTRIDDQRSKAAPAIAAHGLAVHMVHLGDSSDNIWYSTKPTSELEWSANRQIGQASRTAPALASVFTLAGVAGLHMVRLGTSGDKLWHSQLDGTTWTTAEEIPKQASKAAPALAGLDGTVHMVHLGESSNRLWHSWFDGAQ